MSNPHRCRERHRHDFLPSDNEQRLGATNPSVCTFPKEAAAAHSHVLQRPSTCAKEAMTSPFRQTLVDAAVIEEAAVVKADNIVVSGVYVSCCCHRHARPVASLTANPLQIISVPGHPKSVCASSKP